jgi:hypothetical protein
MRRLTMQIRFGYELIYSTTVPTHMILMLNTHLGRGQQYVLPDKMQLSRSIPLRIFTDTFGNTCTGWNCRGAPRESSPMA